MNEKLEKARERVKVSGMTNSEVYTLAIYIKHKLKKKVDKEKLRSLTGDEAINMYDKYYIKALAFRKEMDQAKQEKVNKAIKDNEDKLKKQHKIYGSKLDKLTSEMDKEEKTMQRRAIDAWPDEGDEIRGIPKLMVIRLDTIASHFNTTYAKALSIAKEDKLYNMIADKIYG